MRVVFCVRVLVTYNVRVIRSRVHHVYDHLRRQDRPLRQAVAQEEDQEIAGQLAVQEFAGRRTPTAAPAQR